MTAAGQKLASTKYAHRDVVGIFRNIGVRADAVDRTANQDKWRAAYHEAGHALVNLKLGGTFSKVQITHGDAGIFDVVYRDDGILDDRIVGHIAGAAGEEVGMGGIEPEGCRSDACRAIDRAMKYNAEAKITVGWAFRQARSICVEHRAALVALAKALVEHEVLSREDCVNAIVLAECIAEGLGEVVEA